MLVLSRKAMEGITINRVIRIIIVEIRGNRVRLGIEAPREFGVQRTRADIERKTDALIVADGEHQG